MSPYVSWTETHSALQQHVLEHGHSRAAPSGLQAWMGRQRALVSAGKLSAEKTEALAQLPGALAEGPASKMWITLWPEMRRHLETDGLSFLDRSNPFHVSRAGRVLNQVWADTDPQTEPLRALIRLVLPDGAATETLATSTLEPAAGPAPVLYEDWDAMFTLLRAYLGDHENLPWPSATVNGASLGRWTHEQQHAHRWGYLTGEQVKQLEGLQAWPRLVIPGAWIRGYRALESYIRDTGDSHPHPMAQHGDARIGELVAEARNDLRDGTLAPEKARLLSVLPGWESDLPMEPTSEDLILADLFRYGMEHGHLFGATTSQKNSTERWVSHLRRVYAAGALDPLTEALFTGVPGWNWSQNIIRTRGMLDAATSHLNQHGHLHTTPWTTHANTPLGAWMCEQAEQGHPNASTLDVDPDDLPAVLGPVRRWDALLATASRSVAAAQGALPPADALVGDTPIGAWLLCARYLDGRGLLDGEQSERLTDALRIHGEHWSEHFAELDWVLADGRGVEALRPAARRWIGALNASHAAGVRNQETAAVSGLPGWKWSLNVDDQFDMDLARVRTLATQNQIDLNRLPKSFVVDGFRLGHWVSTLRIRYARRDLPSSWITSLESLPGWTWRAGTETLSTEKWLSLLSDYWVNTGSYKVPAGHLEQQHSLGAWLRNVHLEDQMGVLDPELRDSLSRLIGWEWAIA